MSSLPDFVKLLGREKMEDTSTSKSNLTASRTIFSRTVYVIMKHMGMDGDEVAGIYKTRERALEEAAKLGPLNIASRMLGDYYTVEEEELRD